MRTISWLLVYLIICSGELSAQQKKIDSLARELAALQSNGAAADTNRAAILNALVWQFTNYRTRLDTALSYAMSALDISQKCNWTKGMVESYSNIGRVYKVTSNFDQSISFYKKALALAQASDEKSWSANCLYFMGQVYREAANYPMALDCFFQSLRLNEHTRNEGDMARDLSFIGFTYTEIDDYANALNYHEQALQKHETLKDRYWMAISVQAIAAIYKNQALYGKALEYYARALSMLKGNRFSSYGLFVDIGDVYRSQLIHEQDHADSAWEKGMDYYDRGLATAAELKDSFAMGLAFTGRGSLFLHKHNLPEAKKALHQAKLLLEPKARPDALRDTYYYMSLLDSMNGDWKNALQYYKLYTRINDSLFNRKKALQMTSLQVRYATDKKQEEITLLNKDNEIKNMRIQQQSKNILLIISTGLFLILATWGYAYYRNKRVKQQALKSISEAKLASLKSLMDKHFIFSSLHSIDTFLLKNDAEAASDYLVKYSRLIRSILEMSSQPEVSLEDELSLCRSYLELEKIRLDHRFDYEFTVDPAINPADTQFPSMLLQPLVENAVKHGIGSLAGEDRSISGLISISITRLREKMVCMVTDNGRGLHATTNPPGTHRSYSGKGIIERVRVYNTLGKNKASFLLKDNNPGVSAILTLPYSRRKQSIAV